MKTATKTKAKANTSEFERGYRYGEDIASLWVHDPAYRNNILFTGRKRHLPGYDCAREMMLDSGTGGAPAGLEGQTDPVFLKGLNEGFISRAHQIYSVMVDAMVRDASKPAKA